MNDKPIKVQETGLFMGCLNNIVFIIIVIIGIAFIVSNPEIILISIIVIAVFAAIIFAILKVPNNSRKDNKDENTLQEYSLLEEINPEITINNPDDIIFSIERIELNKALLKYNGPTECHIHYKVTNNTGDKIQSIKGAVRGYLEGEQVTTVNQPIILDYLDDGTYCKGSIKAEVRNYDKIDKIVIDIF